MPTTTSADGTRIAYETIGTGPALILVDDTHAPREASFIPDTDALIERGTAPAPSKNSCAT